MNTQIDAKNLQNYIDRIERLEENKADIVCDIRIVYAEAKAEGYDPKTIREIIKLRKIEQAERNLQDEMLETYRIALDV